MIGATIILVDDHPVFRQGLYHLLRKEKEFKVIGEAGDGEIALEMVRRDKPDVVIMDINMPNLDGIEATRRIVSEHPNTRVIALSVHSGKRFVRDMFNAGAAGYLLKESIPEEMIEGIRTVISGDVYLSKTISNILVTDYKTLISDPGVSSSIDASSLLYTKLHRTPITARIIPRTRLVEFLESSTQNPMTLVAAPAGYGKSILASQWMEVSSLPSGWVSLDEGDNDFRIFLSYFLEAILTVFPEQVLKTKKVITAARLPSVKEVSYSLLNDLETMSERCILVLDDYHHITNRSVNDFIAQLLIHPSPSIHLALITRRDPALPLTTLRARGMLTEISLEHLRFTVPETKLFLERFLHISIAEKTAAVLEDKVEGWVTGLHLAALSIRSDADQDRLIDGLQHSSEYVRDYLIQEALSKAPVPFNQYLLQTSVLSRFCVPLCEALLVKKSSQNQRETNDSPREFINWMTKMHMFVIPLDVKKGWFRYHHLFQQLLQEQLKRSLSRDEIAVLHSRAAAWFAENDLPEEAIEHALAAGDIPFAIGVVEKHRYDFMNHEQWYRLDKLIGRLPPEDVGRTPKILVAKACACWLLHKLDDAWEILAKAERCVSERRQDPAKSKKIVAEIHALYAYKYLLTNEVDLSLERVEQALGMFAVEDENYMLKAASISLFGILHQMKGSYQKALRFIDDALAEKPYPCESYQARLVLGLCFVHCAQGKMATLKVNAEELLKIGETCGLPETMSYARYFLGISHYLCNDPDTARTHLAALADDRFTARPLYYAHGAFAMALNCLSGSQNEEARFIVENIIGFGEKSGDAILPEIGRAFQVELAIREGRIADALEWVRHFSPEPFPLFTLFYVPQLTMAKTLLIHDTGESRQQAAVLLDRLCQFFVHNHNTRFHIQALALQAVLFTRQGERSMSVEKMKEAVMLSEQCGNIRDFVDIGLPIADLLNCQIKRNGKNPYVEMLLEACQDDKPIDNSIATSIPKTPVPPTQPLVDPLTNREMDVLELLAQRLQNKEIAAKLFVSDETVKAHLKNIYQKLSAGNRRQAVEKARALGIIQAGPFS